MSDQKLMAFWSYDLFPYVLHGTIIEFLNDGKVKVKEYNNGIFTPILIVPYAQGALLADQIQKLKDEYDMLVYDTKVKYTTQVENILDRKVK